MGQKFSGSGADLINNNKLNHFFKHFDNGTLIFVYTFICTFMMLVGWLVSMKMTPVMLQVLIIWNM